MRVTIDTFELIVFFQRQKFLSFFPTIFSMLEEYQIYLSNHMTSMTSFIGNINEKLFLSNYFFHCFTTFLSVFFSDNAFLISIDAFVCFYLVLESIYTRQKVIFLLGPCHLFDVLAPTSHLFDKLHCIR